jgi:hypothetical protein
MGPPTYEPIDRLIDARLTGDAQWRATKIRRYGPESDWPPELRNDTFGIITHARDAVLEGREPWFVADLLRPLNRTAQHQAIRVWRTDQGDLDDTLGGLPRSEYLDAIQVALDGPNYAPTDELGNAPILNLEDRTEAELYDYLQRVYEVRGMTFDTNPGIRQVLNIRNYGLTTTEGSELGIQSGATFHARAFTLWIDEDGTKHVSHSQFGSTGVGGSKLRTTNERGDQLAEDAGFEDFDSDEDGKLSRGERSDIISVSDWAALGKALDQEAMSALGLSSVPAHLVILAQGLSQSGTAPNEASDAAEQAMDNALSVRRIVKRCKAMAERVLALTRGSRDEEALAVADRANIAQGNVQGIEDELETAYNSARDTWLVARMQILSNTEEAARETWSLAAEEFGDESRQAQEAHRAWRAAQNANNRSHGQWNNGEMSEMNAVAWLQEGQYSANRRGGTKNGDNFWSINSGMDGGSWSGLSPVDRDWNGDGFIEEGEQNVEGTAVGTGILIHSVTNGTRTSGSIGCQTAYGEEYENFEDSVEDDRGNSLRQFSFSLVDARHLPAWN